MFLTSNRNKIRGWFNISDPVKEAMSRGISNIKKETDPAVIKKIKEIKKELKGLIPKLAPEYDNEIPFSKIHEITGYDYKVISDVLLNMIAKKEVIGFINDRGTKKMSDDTLIIREDHYYKSLEIEYETG